MTKHRGGYGLALAAGAVLCAACINGGIIGDDGGGTGESTRATATGKIMGKARHINMDANDNAGILVTLERTDDAGASNDGETVSKTVRTSADGSYFFNSLDAGGYLLSASSSDTLEGVVTVNAAVDVDRTSIPDDLILTAVGRVTGRIADGTSGVSVYITNTSYYGVSGENGSFTINPVPAGSHTILIGSYKSEPFKVEKGITTTLGEQTLTAAERETEKTFVLAYAANGGALTGGTEAGDIVVGSQVTLPAAGTKTGYTLAGFTLSGAESGEKIPGAAFKMPAGDVTAAAAWTAITYTVVYHANGGSGTTASSTHTYDVAKNLTANGFTRAGYTFAGWAESESGGVVYSDGQSVTNLRGAAGTVTLYAVWHKDSVVSVTFGGGPREETIGWSGAPAASIDWTDNGSLTVTVNTAADQWASGAAFAWYTDGGASSIGAGSGITVNARDYVLGTHTLTVKVTKSGAAYAKTLWFTVVE